MLQPHSPYFRSARGMQVLNQLSRYHYQDIFSTLSYLSPTTPNRRVTNSTLQMLCLPSFECPGKESSALSQKHREQHLSRSGHSEFHFGNWRLTKGAGTAFPGALPERLPEGLPEACQRLLSTPNSQMEFTVSGPG